MSPTLTLAEHLEYLVSAPEDPGDRDKRLLDEWARSVIRPLLLSRLVCLTIISQVQRRGEQCVLLLTLTRSSSLRLMDAPSHFTLRPTDGSRTGRRMGHNIRSFEGVSKHFGSAFTRTVAFCYLVVCKLRAIYVFTPFTTFVSFPFAGNLNSSPSFHPFYLFFLLHVPMTQYLRT